MNPDDVKLIVCDVDGTVARGGQVVSPELGDIFAALAERGIAATLATGRTAHYTRGIAEALGLDGYLICSEGGCVVSMDGREYLHHPHMDAAAIEAAATCVAQVAEHVDVGVLSRDSIYAASEVAWERMRPWGTELTMVGDWRDCPEPLMAIVSGPRAPIVHLCSLLQDAVPDGVAVIQEQHDWAPYDQVKVCSRSVDKGVAAGVLAEHLGLSLANVLSFGDWLNDLGLIRVAGYSIAPRNAAAPVQAAAAEVSRYTFDEGFVARELAAMFDLDLPWSE